MITLTNDAAATIVIIVASLTALWGAFVSVRSAERGPGWAGRHLQHALVGGGVLVAAGLVSILFVVPLWMGLGVTYIASVTVWLTWSVRRSLARVAALGGNEVEIPAERRSAILASSGRGLLAAAGVVAVLSLFDLSWRGLPALADFILVAALAVPGILALRRSSTLV